MSGADPETFTAWTRAWAISRGVAPPVAHGSGVRIDVGRPHQRQRYVFPALIAAEFGALMASIETSLVFLKVCAHETDVAPLLPPGRRIQPPGYMMTADLTAQQAVLPVGYATTVEQQGAMTVARVIGADGVAARGNLVLQGDFAIFDRIRTEPAHERRGLGRAVMRMLATIALDRGIARGVLVATPAGRSLYATLGWSIHSPYTTAVIPDA